MQDGLVAHEPMQEDEKNVAFLSGRVDSMGLYTTLLVPPLLFVKHSQRSYYIATCISIIRDTKNLSSSMPKTPCVQSYRRDRRSHMGGGESAVHNSYNHSTCVGWTCVFHESVAPGWIFFLMGCFSI